MTASWSFKIGIKPSMERSSGIVTIFTEDACAGVDLDDARLATETEKEFEATRPSRRTVPRLPFAPTRSTLLMDMME